MNSGGPRSVRSMRCSFVRGALILGLLVLARADDVLEESAEESAEETLERKAPEVLDYCTSPVYCQGDLLKTVQLAKIYNDSKTFVDLYQKQDEEKTLANFKTFMKKTNNNPSQSEVRRFVNDNFESVDELVNSTDLLRDWVPHPPILSRILDPRYRSWATALNDIWKTLARRMKTDVRDNPKRHSLIYVNNTFIIPGGRFKEFYYWDSYWVIEGLLLSQMHDTTRGIIENFLSIVNTYGFIPNGGRVYYLMRSHPPLLIPMVDRYYEVTKDWNFVNKHLDTLEKEFNYWMRYKSIRVVKGRKEYVLSRYVTNSDGPRPESYREDYLLARNLTSETKKREFYNHVKAGAESGWDFSARWFIGKNGEPSLDLADITTDTIVPVDLNAFLERNARILAGYFKLKRNPVKVKYYKTIAEEYREAIEAVLWNEEDGIWYDYDTRNSRPRRIFYASNFAPLYTGSYNQLESRMYGKRAVEYLKDNRIDEFEGGIPTSLDNSSQQWDLPNAWPPLQSIVVQGLRRTNHKGARDMAHRLAETWLRSNYIAFNASHKMYEKYDAIEPGKFGGGGEYPVQDGFGWSNGVALEFLNAYPMARHQANSKVKPHNPQAGLRPRTDTHHHHKQEEHPRLILKSVWSHYFP